ncbi:MAG: DUF5333 domain-containing protein [Pseudomonadota bacterium]
MILRAAILTLAFVGSAALAQARVPLPEDRAVEDGLTLVAIGNELRKNCDAVSPKYLKTYNFVRGLHSRAKSLGYSEAEIEAYLDSDPDKARVDARARAYLTARGVDYANPETFCTVARAEISAGTSVGSFLREN